MIAVEQEVQELNRLRAEVDGFVQNKSRLTGTLDSGRKRMQELQTESKKQFGCDTEQLPEVMEKISADYETNVQAARDTLAKSAVAPAPV